MVEKRGDKRTTGIDGYGKDHCSQSSGVASIYANDPIAHRLQVEGA